MAKKIDELPAAVTIDTTDEGHLRTTANVDKRFTMSLLNSFIADNIVVVSNETTDFTAVKNTFHTVTTGANLKIPSLPAAATTTGKKMTIQKIDTGYGCARITPNGSEKIIASSGAQLDYLFLFEQGDTAELMSNGTNYYITNNFKPYFNSGRIAFSDQTFKDLGFVQPNYDNLAGTFIVGEVVTGGTSATKGIIIDDTGSQLTVVKLDAGTKQFANNEVLTGGTSAATALINEPTGSTKNISSYILHNFGVDIYNLKIRLTLYYTDDADDGFDPTGVSLSTASTGYEPYQVDNNTHRIITGLNGIVTLNTSSSVGSVWTNADTFFSIYVEVE